MKTPISTTLILLAGSAIALAAPPQKKNVNSYSKLWTDSPFTSKPPPPDTAPEISAFDDWVLGGVSEVEGGYMVTIKHKKNADETQVIFPNGTRSSKGDEMEWLPRGAPGSFTIDRVQYGKESWKDTSVFLAAGGKVGPVTFDEEKLVPTASAAPPPNQAQQPGQAKPNPGAVAPGQAAPRPERRRVLPPVPNTPQTRGQNQRRPSRGR